MLRDNTDPEAELLRCRHEYRPSRFTNRDLHELVNRLSDLLTD